MLLLFLLYICNAWVGSLFVVCYMMGVMGVKSICMGHGRT